MECETVKVKDGKDYKVINKEDFDEKTMKVFEDEPEELSESQLSKMTKPELLDVAKTQKVKGVDDSMTNKDIVSAITKDGK